MELILTDDVPNLGSLGDTVNVKPGYGRNFLIPKGLALLAKGKESKELRHRLEYLKKLREGKIELAKEQASKLKELNLEVVRKSGSEGKLFGSVTNRDISNLLREKNFDFGRKSIILNSSIRSIGNHEFTVKIHSEVYQNLNIKVIGDTKDVKRSEKTDDKNAEIEESGSENLIKLDEHEEESKLKDSKQINKTKEKLSDNLKNNLSEEPVSKENLESEVKIESKKIKKTKEKKDLNVVKEPKKKLDKKIVEKTNQNEKNQDIEGSKQKKD